MNAESNAAQAPLPYGRHAIDDDDIAAVVEVLKGDWLTTGPIVEKFEQALAARVDAAHAVVCSSGTAALHLAALALDLAPDDVVFVPSITFVATANAARYVGAEVVFVDVDATSGLIDLASLTTALSACTATGRRIICPVHLMGQCPDMVALRRIAADHGALVVEDACHAIGTTYPDESAAAVAVGACRHSEMAVFSFHPVKTIAMGEGGAVTTNNAKLAQRMRLMRSHGLHREAGLFEVSDSAFERSGAANPWYYEQTDLGFNYRASDIHCALGLSQLTKLDQFAERRRALAATYDELLGGLSNLVQPVSRTPGCVAAWHLYVVLIDFENLGLERATLMRALAERGIGTQVHYIPVHRQPYYRKTGAAFELPGADAYYAKALTLPMFPAMSTGDVERVVEVLRALLEAAN